MYTTIILFSVLVFGISATVFNCSQTGGVTTISLIHSGTIRSNYANQIYYDNDQLCEWQLDAGENRRIQLTVELSSLQWAPDNAICYGYDYMEIRDGGANNSPLLLYWCGNMNPRSITSSGRQLYLRFETNSQNVYKNTYRGVVLNFQTFEFSPEIGGDCPPGWHFDANGQGNACYKLKKTRMDWPTAQETCAYDHANLATFLDTEEEDFIISMVANYTTDYVWMGYSDIYREGVFWGIDKSTKFSSRLEKDIGAMTDSARDCLTLKLNDYVWQEKYCDKNDKYYFICKMNKIGPTTIYDIPEPEVIKKDRNGPPKHLQWIVIAVVLSVVVITAVVVAIVARYRITRRSRTNSGLSQPQPMELEQSDLSKQQGRRSRTLQSASDLDSVSSAPPLPTYEEAISIQQ